LESDGTREDRDVHARFVDDWPGGVANRYVGGVSMKHANEVLAKFGDPLTQCGVAITAPPVIICVHSPI